jgi:hypothetical protein
MNKKVMKLAERIATIVEGEDPNTAIAAINIAGHLTELRIEAEHSRELSAVLRGDQPFVSSERISRVAG